MRVCITKRLRKIIRRAKLCRMSIFRSVAVWCAKTNFKKRLIGLSASSNEFPDSTVAEDALSQSASAYSRVGKIKEAVSRYQKIIEKYPDAERLDRAYLNIVDVLRDAGEMADALKWTQKTQEVFRGKLPEAVALFSQMRIHLAQNEWQTRSDRS